VGQWLERVPEEDQEVDVPLGDLPADLLVTAQRSAAEGNDVEIELLGEESAGRARRVQRVPGQEIAVERRPFQQIALLVVVRDQRDFLPWLHR
jgi:hypothetical protein